MIWHFDEFSHDGAPEAAQNLSEVAATNFWEPSAYQLEHLILYFGRLRKQSCEELIGKSADMIFLCHRRRTEVITEPSKV